MIAASAILTNQFGEVLLTEDMTSHTLVAPTAPLQIGVLPADTLAQAVRDTIGIIALPVRLTGVYAGDDVLRLVFRAIQRGGSIDERDGRPAAGFFDAIPTPEPMLPAARRLVEDAIRHAGGPPICATTPVAAGLSGRLQKALSLSTPPETGPVWDVRATLILTADSGTVHWQHEAGPPGRHLPAAAVEPGELPCVKAAELAHRLGNTDAEPELRAVYLHPTRPLIDFVYVVAGHAATPVATRFLPGDEPADCQPAQVQMVAHSVPPIETVAFRLLPQTGGG